MSQPWGELRNIIFRLHDRFRLSPRFLRHLLAVLRNSFTLWFDAAVFRALSAESQVFLPAQEEVKDKETLLSQKQKTKFLLHDVKAESLPLLAFRGRGKKILINNHRPPEDAQARMGPLHLCCSPHDQIQLPLSWFSRSLADLPQDH